MHTTYFLIGLLLTRFAAAQAPCSTPTVTLKNGTYVGTCLPRYGQEAYLGVPFAQPPLGQLRLAAPQPLNSTWNGTRNATAYYPLCVGYGGDDIGYSVSEDCLALNVVKPSGYNGQALPVGVWIHGGGYIMGGTADRRYNLSFIVQNSVEIGQPFIGVSIAYRLSAWGFLDSSEIRAAGVTNLGIKDQRLALQWIQENIGAFGGDPSKVTIWGESAGAGSVGIHLIAYNGRNDNLFRGAIGESGNSILLGNGVYNVSIGQAIYNNITAAAGCTGSNVTNNDTLACLRATPYSTLNAAINITNSYSFFPYMDGDLINGSQYDQLMNGRFVKVPLLTGANLDEGAAFGPKGINNDSDFRNYLIGSGVTNETILATIQAVYPNIPALADLLWAVTSTPNATYGAQLKRGAAIGGDVAFHAARRLQCQQWSKYNVSAYCYRFDTIPYPYSTLAGPLLYVGATHFQEVSFVFNNINGYGYELFPGANPFMNEPASYFALSKIMSNSWASFIATGDPNNNGVAGNSTYIQQYGVQAWPRYDVYVNASGGPATGSGYFMAFNANESSIARPLVDDYRGAGIAYLNTLWKSQFGK